jgi:hypothetical protein
MFLSAMAEWIRRLMMPKNRPPVVKLLEKGSSNEAVQWDNYRPYIWRFDVDGFGLSVIYNDQSVSAVWSAYRDGKLVYQGNYIGLIHRFPYLYSYIEFM